MPPAKRRTTRLHAVKTGEKPAAGTAKPKKPLSILEAVDAGDRLAELVAMHRRLARVLDDPQCPPREMASLSRRQMEIGREIDAMKAAGRDEDGEQPVEDEALDPAAI